MFQAQGPRGIAGNGDISASQMIRQNGLSAADQTPPPCWKIPQCLPRATLSLSHIQCSLLPGEENKRRARLSLEIKEPSVFSLGYQECITSTVAIQDAHLAAHHGFAVTWGQKSETLLYHRDQKRISFLCKQCRDYDIQLSSSDSIQ